MAKEESSEQKSLPASEKKLRDARRKGQVSQSRDFVSGFGLLAVGVYLLLFWRDIRDRILQVVDVVANVSSKPFSENWQFAFDTATQAIWLSIAPLVAFLVLAVILAGFVGTFGPVFSFESVKPNFDHINPVSGFKRLFALRSFMEFLKGVFKVALLGSLLFFVLRTWIQSFFETPSCGMECLGPLLLAASTPIVIIAALAFVVLGMFDMGLQRWLFLRDMRMTKTELKRERKDLEGDPLIRSERNRIRRGMLTLSTQLGLRAATFVVCANDCVVGVRYHRTKTPVPTVVCRAKSISDAFKMRNDAFDSSIPVIDHPTLAAALSKHPAGEMVPREHFTEVANILVANNLL
jgi:type III secretion protein U